VEVDFGPGNLGDSGISRAPACLCLLVSQVNSPKICRIHMRGEEAPMVNSIPAMTASGLGNSTSTGMDFGQELRVDRERGTLIASRSSRSKKGLTWGESIAW